MGRPREGLCRKFKFYREVIGLRRERSPSLFGKPPPGVFRKIGSQNHGTVGAQPPYGRRADPRGAAGDDCDFAGEVGHYSLSCQTFAEAR